MPADSRLSGNQSRENVEGVAEDANAANDGGRSSALPGDRQGKSSCLTQIESLSL